VARQNRRARRTVLEEVVLRTVLEVVELQSDPVAGAHHTGLVVDQAEVDIVLEVAAGRTVLEVVVVRIVPGVVVDHTGLAVAVDTVQERRSLAVVGELHTVLEAGRHTGSVAAHHIDLAVVAGRSLAVAGSHRTVDFALVAVDDSLAVEVVDIVDADRILGAAGLGPDTAADNRLVDCSCRTFSAVIPARCCRSKR